MKYTIHKQHYIELNLLEKQEMIKFIKDTFQKELALALNLTRVSAPLFVSKASALNDDLSGVERKVEFNVLADGEYLEIVQSLAKWKRMALGKYNIKNGCGIYTDMNAIRRDDDMDNIHSLYVDQWDWEKVITENDRTIQYLKNTVSAIVLAISATSGALSAKYPQFSGTEKDGNVYFITSQQLLDIYPNLTAKQREYEITKKHGIVFIIQVGTTLSNGQKHDNRAADYDDWQLNGDLMYYHDTLDIAMEISSMGIRVNSNSLLLQLQAAGELHKKDLPYHKQILQNKLPLSIGGGIGQSRLCMLLLHQAHIGEVQCSYWSSDVLNNCAAQGITLL